MVDMITKMKFIISKYSQIFKGVGPGYGELAKFIIIDQYAGFPGEGYKFSFTGNRKVAITTTSGCRTYIEKETIKQPTKEGSIFIEAKTHFHVC
jgi:hypothetical protein